MRLGIQKADAGKKLYHRVKAYWRRYPSSLYVRLCEIVSETDEPLTVKVPSNKTDVSLPADIVEEILRIDGLDNIEIPEQLNIAIAKSIPGDHGKREHMSELLCGMGFNEVITNSIVNSKYHEGRTDLVRDDEQLPEALTWTPCATAHAGGN